MKTIYSLEALQRILDHFSVGIIIKANMFMTLSQNTWLHFIRTSKGDFELFSSPTQLDFEIQTKIVIERTDDYGKIFDKIVHSFDRYHHLVQKTQLTKITPKQAATDLILLNNKKLTNIFRVYGTILQLEFDDDSVIWSYAAWNLQQANPDQEPKVLITTDTSTYQEIDQYIDSLPEKKLSFKSFIIKDEWFEIFFSDGYSLHFKEAYDFPAAEYLFFGKKSNSIEIFNEKEIYYSKELKEIAD